MFFASLKSQDIGSQKKGKSVQYNRGVIPFLWKHSIVLQEYFYLNNIGTLSILSIEMHNCNLENAWKLWSFHY